MLTSIAAMMLASTGPGGMQLVDGRCSYPPDMGPKTAGQTRVACDVAVISPSKEQNSIMVQFASKSSEANGLIGFAGDVDNSGTMSIRRIYLSPGKATPATRGHCRVFRNDDDAITGIACVGWIGERSVVANFRAFAE